MATTFCRVDASSSQAVLALFAASGPEPAACLCTAYHGGESWTAEERATCRARWLAGAETDGYALVEEDGRAAAWGQCAPWTSFAVLAPRPPAVAGAWALTCLVVRPDLRGRGLAHTLLREVISDLRRREVRHLYAFAHRLGPTYSSPLPELPESVCRGAGMRLARDHAECPLYEIGL